MIVNEYVDFDGLWNELVKQNKEVIETLANDDDKTDEKTIHVNIQRFLKDPLPLIKTDCDLTDKEVIFTFGESWGQNESDSVGDFVNVTIVYSRQYGSFVGYDNA
jgi:hypothetical protein